MRWVARDQRELGSRGWRLGGRTTLPEVVSLRYENACGEGWVGVVGRVEGDSLHAWVTLHERIRRER